MKRKRLTVECPEYPELLDGPKVDPRLIDVVQKMIKAMPPAFTYGCFSQPVDDGVLVYGPRRKNPVVPAERLMPDMLGKGAFVGQVCWYFPDTPKAKMPTNDLPVILLKITDKGISIDSKLVVWGRDLLMLSDLIPSDYQLNLHPTDPSEFQEHVFVDEEGLARHCLRLLRRRCQ